MSASAMSNVVDLNERRQLSKAESTRMLNDCRELAMKRLTESLREMLSDIEEDLFQMAESSYDREMQNLYLEVRGQAKERWPKIELAFSRHFVDVFNERIRGEMNSAVRTLAASTHELRLVEDEDLSESIAVQELATRLRKQNEDELSLLGERVAMLLGKNDLKEEDNPISPRAVCDALKLACDEIEGGYRLKLILLKQIEQHVSRALQAVYSDLNSEMVRWNILPNLRNAYRRPVNAPSPVRRPAEKGGAGDEAASLGAAGGGDLLALLQQLMLSPTREPGQAAGLAGFAPGLGGTAPVADERQQRFIDSLTERQRQSVDTAARELGDSFLEQGFLPGGAVNVLHQIRSDGAAQGMGQLDAITIDIVAMLFDFIFDDAKIPDAIKALVGRLQIPVLKVAMLDKSFFSSKTHSARRLLDSISQAALAWGEVVDPEDPLFKEIVALVDRIQNEFEQDVTVFTEAVERLSAVIAERDAQAENIAERSAGLMQRRETEEIAWVVAGEAVSRRLTSSVPVAVQRFLLDHWQLVLKELHLRHGEDHHAYLSAVSMMDDLIWSVAPKRGSDERKQLVSTLPGLLQVVHQGLDVIELPQEFRSKFFDDLVAMHSAAVKAGLAGSDVEMPPEIMPVEARQRPDPAEEYSVNPQGELFITRITENDVQIDEVALVSRNSALDQGDGLPLPQVEELSRGSWVEFQADDRAAERARLSWVSPQRGLFLFTNPRSPRAISISKEALAYQIRSGMARIVSEQPMFERAVNSVLESLSVN